MGNIHQHFALVLCMGDLFESDDLRLLQHLNGVVALVVLRLNKMNASERACSECSQQSEVGQLKLWMLFFLGLKTRYEVAGKDRRMRRCFFWVLLDIVK